MLYEMSLCFALLCFALLCFALLGTSPNQQGVWARIKCNFISYICLGRVFSVFGVSSPGQAVFNAEHGAAVSHVCHSRPRIVLGLSPS
jgi:hypothetical protein